LFKVLKLKPERKIKLDEFQPQYCPKELIATARSRTAASQVLNIKPQVCRKRKNKSCVNYQNKNSTIQIAKKMKKERKDFTNRRSQETLLTKRMSKSSP